MAGFGRSNSLSINTGGGLFGGNASATATSQPASSGGLFGSTAAQPSQSGGLFGGSTQPATSQPASGGLFGNMNKPAAPAAAPGGLFGSSTAQSSAPASGGLFGGALGASTQPAAAPSGGLFGGAQQAKPSLFGASTQQTSTAPSLFGNTNTQQNQTTSTPSLFGSTQQAQPQQSNTLFGGTMNPPQRAGTLGGSTLGGGQMGGSTQAVNIGLENIRGTTRFNDLAPEIQQQIQAFDEGIQRKIGYCSQIRETLPNSEAEVATIAPDVAYIEEYLSTVEAGIDNDSANIAYLRELVKKDAADATLSFRAIENQRLPAQFHYRNGTNLTASSAKPPATAALDEDDPTKPVDLMGYFNRRTGELGRTLDVYQRQIREIEGHLRTMEAGTLEKAQQLTGSRSAPRDQRRELVEALKAIEGAILDSAKKVGQVRDEVTKQTLGNVGATLL
ncbi:nucleoporin NUP49/NSP49 [Stagonosporopsis vannaccii]|nr:nucleoporin NUP49/NSP49 [Stagonosporopsis vannaccii]